MVDHFLEYLSTEKRYSPNTVTAYRKDLADFSEYVLRAEGDPDLARVGKRVVRNFISELGQMEISKRSINRKLSALRSFFLYLLKIGEISISPVESISSLKFYPEKQIPFSQTEMADLADKTDIKKDRSAYLVIETLYQTGMRKSELCGLKIDNFNFSAREIKITGKGNKQRVVPISEALSQELQSYLSERTASDGSEPFFINKKGKKISEKFVYLTVKSYLGSVSTKKKKSPHILRHSFATHILDNGAEISKVKKILGHASLASTQVYTGAGIEQLKKVYACAHPRAKKNKKGPEFN